MFQTYVLLKANVILLKWKHLSCNVKTRESNSHSRIAAETNKRWLVELKFTQFETSSKWPGTGRKDG